MFEQKPEGCERTDHINSGGIYRERQVQEACWVQDMAGGPSVLGVESLSRSEEAEASTCRPW